jgi:pimeloyl-ACP methyl ester carboxylesterase
VNLPLRALLLLVRLITLAVPLAAQDKFFESNGVTIRYIDQGRSEDVVVLLHGFSSDLERTFVQPGLVANLAKGFRVVALDLRGHGKSGKPHDTAAYGKEMCLDVIRLLNHVGVERAHMVGYSQGARVVGYLLTTHPKRFKSATLGGSPPYIGRPSDHAETFAREAQEFAHRTKSDGSDGQDNVALATLLRSRSTQVVTESQLRQVTVPTIGIVGGNDPRLQSVQALKQTMPALLKITVIEGANHGEARTRPEFLRAVREFLESQKAGASPTPK